MRRPSGGFAGHSRGPVASCRGRQGGRWLPPCDRGQRSGCRPWLASRHWYVDKGSSWWVSGDACCGRRWQHGSAPAAPVQPIALLGAVVACCGTASACGQGAARAASGGARAGALKILLPSAAGLI